MKGQNLRLLIGDSLANAKCIAAATECNVHIGAQTEDSSSKDSVGDWSEIEVTGKSWDASATCQFQLSDAGAKTAKDVIALIGTKVFLKFATTSGTNNRTADTQLLSGQAFVTDMQIQSTNKQTVTATIQFTGSGSLS